MRRQQTREFYYHTGPQYGYGRESRLLCMRVTVLLHFENMLHRQQTVSALALGHKHVGF